MTDLPTAVTHPETAWLAAAVGPALGVAIVLAATLLLRGRLALLLAGLQARHGARAGAARPDPALVWAPELIAPGHLLLACALAAAAATLALALVAPVFLALALAAPLAALLAQALVRLAERRYIARVERDLTAAVGRMSALLRAGSGFRVALERLLADLPAGPLRDEWRFLLERQGAPLLSGGIATPQQVVAALAAQTRSARHAGLLDHLSVAVGQPQDVLARRCAAAYGALQSSERRREEALTELAQVRYSGLAVGLAGISMALYLLVTQWERVILAYSSALGMLIGPVVLAALLLPIAGGILLAQVEDLDY